MSNPYFWSVIIKIKLQWFMRPLNNTYVMYSYPTQWPTHNVSDTWHPKPDLDLSNPLGPGYQQIWISIRLVCTCDSGCMCPTTKHYAGWQKSLCILRWMEEISRTIFKMVLSQFPWSTHKMAFKNTYVLLCQPKMHIFAIKGIHVQTFVNEQAWGKTNATQGLPHFIDVGFFSVIFPFPCMYFLQRPSISFPKLMYYCQKIL